MGKVYAVKVGKKTGIFKTWEECKKQVEGYSGAKFKSFKTIEDAKKYLGALTINPTNENKTNNELKPEDKSREKLEKNSKLIAYVDGSFNQNKNKYGFGCVFLNKKKDKVIYTCKGSGNDIACSTMRNVSGEILGSIYAINYAIKNKFTQIDIYYDYAGIEKWANQEWKANKKETQEYQKFVKEARKIIKVNFIKVQAHTGDT